MKKIFMIVALVSIVFSAQAWTREADHGTRVFAREHLDASVVKEYTRILRLGKKYPREKVAAPQDERWGRVSLGTDLRSTTTYEGDVVVQIERAADVLRNRANHSEKEQIEALRSIFSNMILLHNISCVTIEGVEKSKGFKVYTHWGESEPKFDKRSIRSWAQIWGRNATLGFYGYTPEMFAEELRISHETDKEPFSAGTIRDWAADMGKEAAAQLEWAEPDMKLYKMKLIDIEPVHNRLMAKAGFRLAALLNEVLK